MWVNKRIYSYIYIGLKNDKKNVLDVINKHGNLFWINYDENVRLNCLFMKLLIGLVLFHIK